MNNIFKLIIIFALFLSQAAAQPTDSITSNLINNTTTANTVTSTWQNAGTINQPITCWAPGDPGYCGPNPYVNAWGSPNQINFSYGMTELYQMINVGKALPNNGAGLVTTGYRLKFEAKNGNGWDDGRQDYLKAQVTLYGPNNAKVLEQHSYDLNYKFNWTYFSYDSNWNTTKVGYRENQVGNVKLSFYGMDNNFWQGPYGPEIRDITFSLKYRPDPCLKNPLFSPECPNFSKELAEKTATTSTQTISTSSNTDDASYNVEPIKNKETQNKEFTDGKESIYEEGVYLEEGLLVNLDRLIDTLIKIDDNKDKEDKLSMDASKNAISETEKISQQTVRQSEQIASRAVKLSTEIKLENNNNTFIDNNKENKSTQSMNLFATPNTNNTSNILLQPNALQQFNVLQSPQTISSILSLSNEMTSYKPQQTINNLVITPVIVEQTPIITTTLQNNQLLQTQNNTNNFNLLPNAITNPTLGQTIEIPNVQTNFLTSKTDPINIILEIKPNTNDKKEETTLTTVRQNVQDNDLANGVQLAQLSVVPIGFNQYTNLVLRDAAFYAPKEIYRNQRTIDNVRALRNLSSDRLHEEMVNQQYRR